MSFEILLLGRVPLLQMTTEKGSPYSNLSTGGPRQAWNRSRSDPQNERRTVPCEKGGRVAVWWLRLGFGALVLGKWDRVYPLQNINLDIEIGGKRGHGFDVAACLGYCFLLSPVFQGPVARRRSGSCREGLVPERIELGKIFLTEQKLNSLHQHLNHAGHIASGKTGGISVVCCERPIGLIGLCYGWASFLLVPPIMATA